MPITDKQREARRKHLGSSDAPAIMGLSPYRNRSDVFFEKTGQVSDGSTSHAAVIGNVLENSLLDWFASDRGLKIKKNQLRVHENGVMSASLDALVEGGEEAVESKTSGLMGPLDKEAWGEPETDEVPEYIVVQVQHQMAVLPSLKRVWIPALLGGVGLTAYCIERDEEIIRHLEQEEMDFWSNYVLKGVQPPDIPSMDTLKLRKREPGKSVEVDQALIQDWLEASEASKVAAKAEKELKQRIIDSIGDAESGLCPLGEFTYREQSRKGYVVKPTTFRVPRFKKAKGVKNGKAA